MWTPTLWNLAYNGNRCSVQGARFSIQDWSHITSEGSGYCAHIANNTIFYTFSILCYRYNALVDEHGLTLAQRCHHWLHLPHKWTRCQKCTRHKHAETTNSLLTTHIKVTHQYPFLWFLMRGQLLGGAAFPSCPLSTHIAPTCFLCLQQQRKRLAVKRSPGNHFRSRTHCTQIEECYCVREVG